MRAGWYQLLITIFGGLTVMLSHEIHATYGIMLGFVPLWIFEWLCFDYGAKIEKGDFDET